MPDDYTHKLAPRRGRTSTMSISPKKDTVLAAGEIFIECPDTGIGTTGTYKIKLGDGTTTYENLPTAFSNERGSEEPIIFNEDTSVTVQEALGHVASGALLKTQIAGLKKAVTLDNALFSDHDSDTSIHVSENDREELEAAYDHSQSAHAPVNAEVNTIEGIKQNGNILTPDQDKIVNITTPTRTSDLINDSDFVEDANYVHTDNNYTTDEKNKLAALGVLQTTTMPEAGAAYENRIYQYIGPDTDNYKFGKMYVCTYTEIPVYIAWDLSQYSPSVPYGYTTTRDLHVGDPVYEDKDFNVKKAEVSNRRQLKRDEHGLVTEFMPSSSWNTIYYEETESEFSREYKWLPIKFDTEISTSAGNSIVETSDGLFATDTTYDYNASDLLNNSNELTSGVTLNLRNKATSQVDSVKMYGINNTRVALDEHENVEISYEHPNSGVTAGTYKSVTVDVQGHVTAGTNPTTLAGFGITDAQAAITGAASTITDNNLDAGKLVVTDANGKIAASNTSAEKLGYLANVTSDVQNQLNNKADNDDIPVNVSELNNDAGYTTNLGTITGVSINGSSVATSGVANITEIPALLVEGKLFDITANTPEASDNSEAIATTEFVKTALAQLPAGMSFQGSLGTGGTISTLPTASAANKGYTYKVITDGTYDGKAARVGDLFISNETEWVLIPSGDDPGTDGTVTSVKVAGVSPIVVDNENPITTSGVRNISHATSGATAGSYGDTTAQTPNYGETFNVLSASINATGHITAIAAHTVKIPEAVEVPTKTSDLTNDSNFIADSTYVHTDNNYTTAEKNKLADLSNIQVTTIPTATAELVGKIVQFIGTTSTDFVNGRFYRCINTEGVYSWEEVSANDVSISAEEDNLIVMNDDGLFALKPEFTMNTINSTNGVDVQLYDNTQAVSTINIKGNGNTEVTMSGEDQIMINYNHPTSGVQAGSYKSVTVDNKGHVTAGTNPTTLAGFGITDGQQTITGAASSVTSTDLNPNKVLTSTENGKIGQSDITATELGALSGIESNIQDQIDAKSTVSFTRSLSSGTKIGTITIDSTPTDIFCESGGQGTVTDVQKNGVSVVVAGVANVTVPTDLSDLTDDATHRTVSDTDKTYWNNKPDFSDIANFVVDANYVHTDNNYTTTEKNKLAALNEDAEENVIDTIKVNGVEQTPVNKVVDITVPTVDTVLDTSSNNPVANAPVATAVNQFISYVQDGTTSSNKLVNKSYVDGAVARNAAIFRGNWDDWADVPSDGADYPEVSGNTKPTPHDYIVVLDASDYPYKTLEGVWRFKYNNNWDVEGKDGWIPEYQVNESPMSQEQLDALNSGITAAIVATIPTASQMNAKMDKNNPSGTGNLTMTGNITDGSGNVLANKSEVSANDMATSSIELLNITIDGQQYIVPDQNVTDVQVNGTTVMDDTIAKITVPTSLSQLTEDSTHRVITDSERTSWDNKADSSDIPTDLEDLNPTASSRHLTDTMINNWNSKSSVSFEQTLTSGTKIGTITINNTPTDLYCSEGGGGESGLIPVNPTDTSRINIWIETS